MKFKLQICLIVSVIFLAYFSFKHGNKMNRRDGYVYHGCIKLTLFNSYETVANVGN